MSGHSKWSQIKRQKGVADVKRGGLFTKLTKAVTLAAKDGADPNMNFKLRLAIDLAKAENMPNDNIERAIKRGSGQVAGVKIEEAVYEIYGHFGAALIVVAATDNKNRTTAEVKSVLNKFGAKLAPQGGVLYLFDYLGEVIIDFKGEQKINREEIELLAIDAGATDIDEEDFEIFIYCDMRDLSSLREALQNKNLNIKEAKIIWKPKTLIDVTPDQNQQIEKLLNALETVEDVHEIFINV